MATRSRAPAKPDLDTGRRLRQLRLARRMTQGELAGGRYSVSYISAIERGQARPSLGVLQWCADQLDIPLQELFPASRAATIPSGPAGQRMAQAVYARLRAKVEASAGRHAQAQTLLAQLRTQSDDAVAPALVWYSAFVASAMGDGVRGRAEAERFARLADERKQERERAGAHLLSGLLYANAHEDERAVAALRTALVVASSALVDLDFRLVASSTLATTLSERGSRAEAIEALGQALETFERFADPAGRTADAERLAEQAAAGDDFLCACTFALWAWMSRRILNAERTGARLYLLRAMLAGDAALAERENDLLRAHALATTAGDEPTRLVASAYMVAMLAEAGEAERAQQAAAKLALVGPEEVKNAPALGQGLVALAHGWLAQFGGEKERALAYAAESQEALVTESEASRPEVVSAYASLAELYMALDDAQHASAALRRAVQPGRRPPAL